MKKYALYTYPGRESERGWPQLGGEEMEQTCERVSDWYCHIDDVAAMVGEKDREIAALTAQLQEVESVLREIHAKIFWVKR